MAWNNSWYLVPHESVGAVVHPAPGTDPQDVWPHVAYADGGIEGRHFQALWDQLQGAGSGPGRPMCAAILHTGPEERWPRRVGRVCPEYVAALSALTDEDAAALASSSWRESFLAPWATPGVLVAVLGAWRVLARRAIAEDKAVVMEWYR